MLNTVLFGWGIKNRETEEYQYNLKIKHVIYTILILVLLITAKCSFVRITIDAGKKGVVVSKPYFFGNNGVQNKVYEPGSYWFWKSNEVWEINVLPSQVAEKFDDMYSSDNIPVDFDAFLNYQIVDPISYKKNWGEQWYANNIAQTFRTAVRDECKRYKMNELVSGSDITNKIETATLKVVQDFSKEKKLPVVFTKCNVGKINPNKDVATEIAQTAIQQQRQRTELDKKKAEDNRRQTEISRAAADNAYREAMGLAPEQYIRLEAVKAYSHAAEVCAKNPACTMILTQPGTDVKATIPIHK